MKPYAIMFDTTHLPELFIRELDRFQKHWVENANEQQQKELDEFLLADDCLKKQLTTLLVASEYAKKQLISHPEILPLFYKPSLVDLKKELSVQDINLLLMDRLSVVDHVSTLNEIDFEKALREVRRDFQLRIIWRDVNRLSDLENTVRELSVFAEQCITQSANYYYLNMVKQWGVPISNGDQVPGDGEEREKNVKTDRKIQPFLVLGMGKLGAGELNLSSDIDLIFTYPETGETEHFLTAEGNSGNKKNLSNQEFFVRLGQKIIKSLDPVTADGFVFRVDMRLRPYGQSGALVMNFDSLENYYETQGREWERYAMIKARVVASTSDALLADCSQKINECEQSKGKEKTSIYSSNESAAALMALLQPFTYRKYIDFSAIEALRAMKLLITREVTRKGLQADVKLGAGGIREVEFIVQAFQLIRGGRDSRLQERKVLKVLPLLVEENFLPKGVDELLADAYIFLRNTEHAIQSFQDRQTQQLPIDPDNQLRLAYVMGFNDWDGFISVLDEKRKIVSEQFGAVVSEPEKKSNHIEEQAGEWASFWDDFFNESCEDAFVREHYQGDATVFVEQLNNLCNSRQVLAMQASAKEKLHALVPLLLADLSTVDNPDDTLIRVCLLIEAIVRRSVYIVLLLENPSARLQVIRLCSASSWIANQLTEQPVLLDELLDARQLYSPPDLATLKDELRREVLRHNWDDLESHMESLRYFRMSHVLRVAACEVTGILPLMKVSDYLTYIAEVILQHVLDLAWKQMVARYGRPKRSDGSVCDPDFIIVGYGKLGGIELGHGSDLDLVFIHNGDVHQTTEGPKEIDSPTFFTRLGQKIIHILNTQTISGQLYEVDMRLRPSGNSGLLVTSLAGFDKYQDSEAWTWEHQALVRARVVAGSQTVRESFEVLREKVLSRERVESELKDQVREMRVKMRTHLGSKSDKKPDSDITIGTGEFHVKHDSGGIVDIEFMVQYAVLVWAKSYPSLMAFTDNIRIIEALKKESLFSPSQAEHLVEAYKVYRSMVHRLALQGLPAIVSGDAFIKERKQVTDIWNWLIG